MSGRRQRAEHQAECCRLSATNADLAEQYGADLQCVRPASFEERLRSFYAIHNPEKLASDLTPIVEYYIDDEEELNADLAEQYEGADLHDVPQFVADPPGGGGGGASEEEEAAVAVQRVVRGMIARTKLLDDLVAQLNIDEAAPAPEPEPSRPARRQSANAFAC